MRTAMSTSVRPPSRFWRSFTASLPSSLRSPGDSERLIFCSASICFAGSCVCAAAPDGSAQHNVIAVTAIPATRTPTEHPFCPGQASRATRTGRYYFDFDDDEVAVVRKVRVPTGRAEVRVVYKRELVVGQREHRLDRLVRELERVAEAEVAGAGADQREAVLVLDVEQVDDLALGQVRAAVRHVDHERLLPGRGGALAVVALGDDELVAAERDRVGHEQAGLRHPVGPACGRCSGDPETSNSYTRRTSGSSPTTAPSRIGYSVLPSCESAIASKP